MKAERVAQFCGANTSTGVLDAAEFEAGEDVIAYGCSRNIALAFTSKGDEGVFIHSILPGAHDSDVRCLAFYRDKQSELRLISGSADGSVAHWHLARESRALVRVASTSASELGISAVCGCSEASVSASLESPLRIWDPVDGTLVESLPQGNAPVLSIALTRLSDGSVLLATGEESRVRLWLRGSKSGSTFQFVHAIQDAHPSSWIHALAFHFVGSEELLLASGAQDGLVKLWKFAPITSDETLPDESEEAPLRVRTKAFPHPSRGLMGVWSEAVLAGHDGWVYGLRWTGDGCLLSASMDKSLVLWAPTDQSIWLDKGRVGEVGGSCGGFYGGVPILGGSAILAHTYQGGLYLWHRLEDGLLKPGIISGGHFGPVADLAWSPDGSILMTAGGDATTRAWAPWRRNGDANWIEIARPQIHGWPLHCLCVSPDLELVSGAEEKVIRTFRPPVSFLESLGSLSDFGELAERLRPTAPPAATLPSLALSNQPKQSSHVMTGDTYG